MSRTENKTKHTAVESALWAYCSAEGKARKAFAANPTESNRIKMEEAIKQHEDYKQFFLYAADEILHDVRLPEID